MASAGLGARCYRRGLRDQVRQRALVEHLHWHRRRRSVGLMRESVLLLRRVGLFCAFLVLIALVTIAVSASASRMRPHSGKPRKPDPCAVHKRPSASAARRHKLVCRTRTRRVKLSVHDAHGPYATPPLQKEIDEATAPRLPVGPYRPRNGPKVLLTAPSTATGHTASRRQERRQVRLRFRPARSARSRRRHLSLDRTAHR